MTNIYIFLIISHIVPVVSLVIYDNHVSKVFDNLNVGVFIFVFVYVKEKKKS